MDLNLMLIHHVLYQLLYIFLHSIIQLIIIMIYFLLINDNLNFKVILNMNIL